MEGVGFAQLSGDEDRGGADPFLRSPVSHVFSSGMLMEVAQLTPPSIVLGCAAEDCVLGRKGSLGTPQAPCLQQDGGGWLCMAPGPACSTQHSELTPPPAPMWKLGNI